MPVPLSTRRRFVTTAFLGATTVVLAANADTARGSRSMVPPDGMVLVAGGPFRMGTAPEAAARLARRFGYHPSWLSGETPERSVDLPAFAIDRFPVTNGDYARFCAATGHGPPSHWIGGQPPAGLLDHPVASVSHPDAMAYASWAGKRLPTEAEWEKAARGTAGLLFPWGEEFDPEACQFNRDGLARYISTAPVGAHPRGISPCGAMDMVGNVAEWCADGPGPASAYLKGGSWMNAEILNLRPASRGMSGWAANALPFYGFRCARDME
jgi:formylglycine-generating enzyme required for sulfatase activity